MLKLDQTFSFEDGSVVNAHTEASDSGSLASIKWSGMIERIPAKERYEGMPAKFFQRHCRLLADKYGARYEEKVSGDYDVKVDTNKLKGMLIGLAIGDAMGMSVEFKPKGSFEEVKEYRAGGPFNLPAGYWTDDTSMALCLADSIISKGGYDSYDVMGRYVRWMEDGYRSSTGECFDIGNQVRESLASFHPGDQISVDERRTESAGNGCIMRLAPVVIASIASRRGLYDTVRYSSMSARETHFSSLAERATGMFGGMLFLAATKGLDKKAIISDLSKIFKHESILKSLPVTSGFDESELKPTGFIIDTLELAVWAFENSTSFKEGMLKAINFGGDSDTIGAVFGQLAGAYYGFDAIPKEWVSGLFQSKEIIDLVDQLIKVEDYELLNSRFREDRFGGYSPNPFFLLSKSDDNK